MSAFGHLSFGKIDGNFYLTVNSRNLSYVWETFGLYCCGGSGFYL